MKKILCYGDSNTLGYNPKNSSIIPEDIRWSGILKEKLKNSYDVIEMGAPNRTAFCKNPQGDFYCGLIHLKQILNDNVDIIILSLGTNDLQFQYNINSNDFEKGINKLLEIVRPHTKRIILVPPVILKDNILKSFFNTMFNEESIKKSKEFINLYEKISTENHCEIFDFNKYVDPSYIDGLHYEEKSHKIIANKLIEYINS